MRHVLPILAAAGLLACQAASGQTSSLLRREQGLNRPTAEPRSESTLRSGATPATSFIALRAPEPQTFARHDLVTIIIREQATHTSSGSAQTSRDSGIDGGIDQWTSLHLSGPLLQPSQFEEGRPGVAGEIKREFTADGSVNRSDSVVARITAEIIDIKPNGNLVLQASKAVRTDEESYTITLTGVCRTRDVSPDNSILSTQIAELEIVKVSDGGAVRDATQRGWLHRAFDAANLF